MYIKELSDKEMDSIVGGSIYDGEMFIGVFCVVMIILVAAYKLYNSNKGKVTIGDDYGFEWS